MAVEVIINNTPHIIPEPDDENYAEDLQAYLVDIAQVLNSVVGPLDILQTDFIFSDGQTNQPVTNFTLPTTNITKFTAQYSITRRMPDSYDAPDIRVMTETGTLVGTKTKNSDWEVARIDTQFDPDSITFDGVSTLVDDIGVELDMNPDDQLTYTSTDLGALDQVGTSMEEGIITFKVTTLEQ